MRGGNKFFRLMASLAVVMLVAAGCGDDGDEPTATSGDTTDAAGDGNTGGENEADDAPADDGSDTDDSGGDAGGGDDVPAPGSSLDCAEIEAAVEAASDLSTVDVTGGSAADDLQQNFNESRAALAAIGDAAPEIAGEVAEALEGLDVIGEAFASIDWDPSNPADAMQIAGAMGDADVIGMIGAMSAISAWVAQTCSS